jgi:hypothetical protein
MYMGRTPHSGFHPHAPLSTLGTIQKFAARLAGPPQINPFPFIIMALGNKQMVYPETQTTNIVAIYKSHAEAGQAVHDLNRLGFDIRRLSIAGPHYHPEEVPDEAVHPGECIKYWGRHGGVWTGMWGLMVGSTLFWIPGLGPMRIARPLVTWIIAALEGAILLGGLSAIASGPFGLGIPKEHAVQYESALREGHYLLIAHGPVSTTLEAKAILQSTHPDVIEEHPVHQLASTIG